MAIMKVEIKTIDTIGNRSGVTLYLPSELYWRHFNEMMDWSEIMGKLNEAHDEYLAGVEKLKEIKQ